MRGRRWLQKGVMPVVVVVIVVVVAAACTRPVPTPEDANPPASPPVSVTTTTVRPDSTTTSSTSTSTTSSTSSTSTSTTPTTSTTTTTVPPLTQVEAAVVSGHDAAMPIQMRLPVAETRPFLGDVVASWATTIRSDFTTRARALIRRREEEAAARAAAEAEAARVAAEAEAARIAANSLPPDSAAPATTTTTTTTTTTVPPPPPPPPPELFVDHDQPARAAGHAVVRLRTTTQLGAPPESLTTAIYVFDDGPIVTSMALIDPPRVDEFVDLVRALLADRAGEWQDLAERDLLTDIAIDGDGGLVVTVPSRYLAPGAVPDPVRVDPETATDFLSTVGQAARTGSPLPNPGAPDCASERCVALTFDDGPSTPTIRLLDVLDHADAPATFFLLGRNVERSPEIAARIAVDGHAIGNHTWSHPNLKPLTTLELDAEITPTDEIIRRVTGQDPTLIRPPYGAFDYEVQYLLRGLVHWDVDTRDWEHRDPARTVATSMRQVEPGSVILLHDIHEPSVDAVGLLIAELRAAGYRLVTVPDLLGEIEPGTVYFSQHRNEVRPPPTTTTTTTTTTLPPTTVPATSTP